MCSISLARVQASEDVQAGEKQFHQLKAFAFFEKRCLSLKKAESKKENPLIGVKKNKKDLIVQEKDIFAY